MNSNGVLSSRNPFILKRPQPFPRSPDILIALFWDDFDVLVTGRILYRVTSNQTLLDRVGASINDETGFSPSSLFIATWDRVARNLGTRESVTPQV